MLVNITTVPARAIVKTVPAHTDIEVAYEFEDLSREAQERAVKDMRDDRLEWDMEGEFEFYKYEHFPHSKPQMEWCAGYCQGDGVNVYGTFSINDLLAYAGLETIEWDFDVEIEPNSVYGCTYCTWDLQSNFWAITDAVNREFDDWLYDNCDENDYMNRHAEVFTSVWEKRAEAICEAMTRLCRELYRHMDSLAIGDAYFDPAFHEDILYDEDGIWLSDRWEWPSDSLHMTVREYEEAF